MLKLWLGIKQDYENFVTDPDFYFGEFIDFSCINNDFAKGVVKTCSDVAEVINYANMILPTGEIISPRELSSGAKNLLIMMYDEEDAVCDMVWCGENCEPFVAEIAKLKDLTLVSSRFFNPFDTGKYPDGVEILNTGKTVYSTEEFIYHALENELIGKLGQPD